MKITALLMLVTLLAATSFAAEASKDSITAGEKRRHEIPLGGDFHPDPKTPAFVAVGHGTRIVFCATMARRGNRCFGAITARTTAVGRHIPWPTPTACSPCP